MRYQLKVNPVERAVQPGAVPRSVYQIGAGARPVEFASTPARTWYATRYPGVVPTVGDWQADADGNGVPSLLEYAFGAEPWGGIFAPTWPQASVAEGKLMVRFVRPPGRSDLNYRLEGAAGLGGWVPVPVADLSDGPATVDGEPRRFEVPLASGFRFLRVAVDLGN